MKKCALCKVEKKLTEFHKNSRSKDGLHCYCKQCNSLKANLQQKTPQFKEYQKEYYKTEKGKAALKRGVSKKIAEGYYRYGKGAIPILKQGAKKRNISFSLTPESLDKWWRETPDKCYYCGVNQENYVKLKDFIVGYQGNNYEISKYKRFYKNSKHRNIKWMTIDRINNKNGYQIGNIVKCCWICNSMKSDFFSEEIMKLIAPRIIKKLRKEILIKRSGFFYEI